MSDDEDVQRPEVRTKHRGVSEGAVVAAHQRYQEALATGGDPLWAMRLALETAKHIDVSDDVLGIPPVAIDDEPTAMEHLIAADAERWHYECVRRGSLFEQTVGATVLGALVRARVAAMRVLAHDMSLRLREIEGNVEKVLKRLSDRGI